MTEIRTKYFSVEEAQLTLPLVRKIVNDILNSGKKINQLKTDRSKRIEENSDVLNHVNQINKFIAELEEIGCYYKDWSFEIGLVDFPAIINGEEVFLCWRSDEDTISHYHGISAGYSGRKMISANPL